MVLTSRWGQDGRLLFWSMLRVPVLPLDQQIQLGLIWAHSPSCWQSADASDSSWLADARFTLSSVHLTTSHHRCPSVEKRWSRDQPAELPVSSVFFNHMTCILRDLTHTHARVHHCCHTHSWWTRAHNHDGQGQVSNPKIHAECMLCLQRWSHLSNRLFPPVCELTVQTWIYAD